MCVCGGGGEEKANGVWSDGYYNIINHIDDACLTMN